MRRVSIHPLVLLSSAMIFLLSACSTDESNITTLSTLNETSSHVGARPAVHMELKQDGEVICKAYNTPADTPPIVTGCPDGRYVEQLFRKDWSRIGENRDVVISKTHPAPDDLWRTVSESSVGWLEFSGGKPVQGKDEGNPRDRFSQAKAPDGSPAVQHTIKKGIPVHPLGADTPILLSKPYKAARLSYKIWIEEGKGRGQPGKYMSLMGGRGQAGGTYENGPGTGDRSRDAEGWSYYLLSPVTYGSKGNKNARNGHRAGIGAANRSEFDNVDCRPPEPGEDIAGGDPINGDDRKCFEYYHGKSGTTATGRWVAVVMTVKMNTKGNRDGLATYSVDGKPIVTQKGVMWALDPDKTLDLWVRWRMMYGGTPSELEPPQDLKEWYKDFALEVIY